MSIAIIKTAVTATVLAVTAVGGAYCASVVVASIDRHGGPASPPSAARPPAAVTVTTSPAARALNPVALRHRTARPARSQVRAHAFTPVPTRAPEAAPTTGAPAKPTGNHSVTTPHPSAVSPSPSGHGDSTDDSSQSGNGGPSHDE